MGNKISKSEPTKQDSTIPSRCLYVQGLNDYNQCGKDGSPFATERVVVTAVGGMNHSIAILNSGEFVSWGSNQFGQLGTEPDSFIVSYIYEPSVICPIILPKEIGAICIVCISAGMWHSACVTNTGKLLTWGLGTDGQLGINPLSFPFQKHLNNTERFLTKPTIVESLSGEHILAVNCGSSYTIARTSNSKVFSFGDGSEGVLGNGNLEKTCIPQEILSLAGIKLKKVACGWNHCLALTSNGKVYYWGNQYKDIIENSVPELYPKRVSELEEYKISQIACGDYHSCALTGHENKKLFVWGSNGYGQLGDHEMSKDSISMSPVEIRIDDVSQVVCGGLFTLVNLKDGSCWGWGCNRQKQLGSGYESVVPVPEMIMGGRQLVKRISCGYSHAFFLSSNPIAKSSLLSLDDDKRSLFSLEIDKPGMSKDHTDDRI